MTSVLLTTRYAHAGMPGSTSFSGQEIAASDAGWASAFQPHTTDAITHLGVRYHLRTGTPPTFKVTLETLDTSGLPSGTDVGGGSPTLTTFTPPADTTWDATLQWFALTNSYTPTMGQFLAATVRYSSGTIDGSNKSAFSMRNGFFREDGGFPYLCQLTGGVWAKVANVPAVMYRTANGRFGQFAVNPYTTAITTAGHRSGMFFTEPTGVGSNFMVVGLELSGQIAAAAGSCKVGIWNGAGTEVASVTVDGDCVRDAGANTNNCKFYFTSPAVLNFGTKYYAGLEVISGNCVVNGWDLSEAANRSWFPNGVNRGYFTWNGSAYTEVDTRMAMVDLILSDVAVAGGFFHRGMNGGVNG